MKICIVGLGSIGKRHIKNLTSILTERNVGFQIDALRSQRKPIEEGIRKFISIEYYEVQELPNDYDIIFLTNPTSQHYDAMKKLASKTKHMFIEKPVFDYCNYNLQEIDFQESGIYYVACPLRYTRVIQWLKEFIEKNKVYAARAICSTYLPEWRPTTDYRNNYSAKKEFGGGVSMDLIHEWDYMTYLFGEPDKVHNFSGTYSDLEIDSDDVSIYIGKFKDKLISLHLDYFGRFPKRDIELYTEKDVVVGDLINNQVKFLNAGRVIDLSENRDDYQILELKYFLNVIEGRCSNTNDIKTALKVLSIAKGAYNE